MISKLLSLFIVLLSLGQTTIEGYVDQMSLGGNLFLINRDFRISADYVPDDLVKPSVKHNSDAILMREEAAHALEELFAAAKEEEGYTLIAVSGYRSYGTQKTIYNRKVKSVGEKKANLTVALPGASEHQLGLAMDITCKSVKHLSGGFGNQPEGQWVAENCWRFGFIIRYKAEWTDTTGYSYEPWHIRYVGKEHAERIWQMDIPLEDYVALLREARQALVSPDSPQYEE